VTDTPGRRGVGGRSKPAGPRSIRRPKRLWMFRPFSRIVQGRRYERTVRNYIQLNEKEARGEIPYRKTRLRGLSSGEWTLLWR
jgi:hypothetical protein